MPISRGAQNDLRQRREFQKMAAGRDVEHPLARRDTGDLYLMLALPSGLEITALGLAVEAGDGIQLTADGVAVDLLSPGFLELDGVTPAAQLTVREVLRTRTRTIYIEDPEADDEFPIGLTEQAITILEIHGQTDAGTLEFNIEFRPKAAPAAPGTEIADAANIVADIVGATQSGFANDQVPADHWLVFVGQGAVAGTPTKLWVTIEQVLDPT